MASFGDISDRQEKAAEHIAEKGFVSLSDLSKFLQVSESTARRDVDALVLKGSVLRTHGGVICMQYRSGYRLAASERGMMMRAEKQAVARATAGLVEEGQSVLISGGSTCCHVAEHLCGQHLNVVTNCPQIASMLSADMESQVTLLGGYVFPRTGVALGATAERQLEGMRVSLAILGCASIGPEGIYNGNQIMVDMDRKIIHVADKVILVADHSKFLKPSLIKQCNFDEIDVLVTDSGISKDWIRRLKAMPLELVVASSEGGCNYGR